MASITKYLRANAVAGGTSTTSVHDSATTTDLHLRTCARANKLTTYTMYFNLTVNYSDFNTGYAANEVFIYGHKFGGTVAFGRWSSGDDYCFVVWEDSFGHYDSGYVGHNSWSEQQKLTYSGYYATSPTGYAELEAYECRRPDYSGEDHYDWRARITNSFATTLYYDVLPIAQYVTTTTSFNGTSATITVRTTQPSGTTDIRAPRFQYRTKVGSNAWSSWQTGTLSSAYEGTFTISSSGAATIQTEIKPGYYKRNIQTSSTTPSLSSNIAYGKTVSRSFSLTGATAPTNFRVNYPEATTSDTFKTTYNTRPYISVYATKGAGSDNIQVQYRIYADSAWGSWTSAGTASSNTNFEFQLPAQTVANHRVQVRAVNPNNTSLATDPINCYIKIASPPSVAAGDLITDTQMDNLRVAISNLLSYYSQSYTITDIADATLAQNANWTSYAAGANQTPHISGLAAPGQGVSIQASYYNSYKTKLLSG